jgi:predicted phage gp36 major capsid-like protein
LDGRADQRQRFGTNHRPTGQRGLFRWFRCGGDVVVDNAFRMLTA